MCPLALVFFSAHLLNDSSWIILAYYAEGNEIKAEIKKGKSRIALWVGGFENVGREGAQHIAVHCVVCMRSSCNLVILLLQNFICVDV